jgi:hypothetical protein
VQHLAFTSVQGCERSRTFIIVISYLAWCSAFRPCLTSSLTFQRSSDTGSCEVTVADECPTRGVNQGVNHTRLNRSNCPRSKLFLQHANICYSVTGCADDLYVKTPGILSSVQLQSDFTSPQVLQDVKTKSAGCIASLVKQ